MRGSRTRKSSDRKSHDFCYIPQYMMDAALVVGRNNDCQIACHRLVLLWELFPIQPDPIQRTSERERERERESLTLFKALSKQDNTRAGLRFATIVMRNFARKRE